MLLYKPRKSLRYVNEALTHVHNGQERRRGRRRMGGRKTNFSSFSSFLLRLTSRRPGSFQRSKIRISRRGRFHFFTTRVIVSRHLYILRYLCSQIGVTCECSCNTLAQIFEVAFGNVTIFGEESDSGCPFQRFRAN